MNERRRPPPLAIVLGGLVGALVVIVALVLVQRMSRQEPAPPADEKRSEETTPAVATEGKEEVAPQAETEEKPADENLPTTEGEAPGRVPYSISGCVVDVQGRGVVDATVQARLGASGESAIAKEVTTDASGAFRLDGLPKRNLFLAASQGDRRFYLPGLKGENQEGWCFPIPYLRGRDRVTGIRLTLRPTAAIAGTVVETDDVPIPGAVVTVYTIEASVETDEQGRFRITGLLPGRCWLRAEAQGFLELEWMRACTGCGDVVLRLKRGLILQGNAVFAESGEPAPGAAIRAEARLGSETPEVGNATADADGHFEILVHPDAPTTLTACCEEYVSDPERVVEVTPLTAVSPVTIELVKGGSISGIVREEGTKLPVAGVGIEVKGPSEESQHVESDSAGRFSLTALAPGPHVVSLDKFQPFQPTMGEPEITVDVAPGEAPTQLEFWVTAKQVVTGTVVDTEGEPVFGAVVTPRTEKGQQTDFLRPTTTDADGRFLVRQSKWVITGLVVSHPDFCHAVVELEQATGADVDRTTTLLRELRGESATEVGRDQDVRIVLEKGGGSIAGRVANEGGAPRQDVRVRLQTLDAMRTQEGWSRPEVEWMSTDEAGRYIFDTVAPGTYRLKATVYGQEFQSDEVTLEAGQRMEDVNLTIPPSGTIAGRVTNEDGTPVACLYVNAIAWMAGPSSWTLTDVEGRYTFDNLAQGRKYQVRIDTQEQGYTGHACRMVACPADNQDFVLMRAKECTVRGFVYRRSDAGPVPQFKIHVSTTRHSAGGGSTTSAKRYEFLTTDGSFVCAGVLPGELSLTVYAPGFCEFTSEPFRLEAGGEATQTVYLDTGGTLRGAVYRKSDGSPVTKYQLRLRPEQRRTARDWLWWQGDTKTIESDDGTFERANVYPGMYRIEIATEGLPNHITEPFEVADDVETEQNIYLGEGGIIRGRVVDEAGRPIPDVTVSAEGGRVGHVRVTLSTTQGLPMPNSTATNSAGAFELRQVTLGQVTLHATHAEYAECEVRNVAVTEDVPTEGVVITLERGAVLYGWVKDLDGKLLKEGELQVYGRQSCTAKLDENGEYRTRRLARGTYPLGLTYLDATPPPVTIDGDEDVEYNIDFSQAGTISGKVNLPSQSEHVALCLYLSGLDGMGGIRWAETDDDQTFEVKGIFEGRYRMYVSASSATDPGRTFEVRTSPEKIIITVGPDEDVKHDIDVVTLKECEPH